MKVRLTRLVGGAALRTDSIEGEANEMPATGQQFYMSAPPLAEGNCRWVNTSTVVELHDAGEFTTKSGSRYRVELL